MLLTLSLLLYFNILHQKNKLERKRNAAREVFTAGHSVADLPLFLRISDNCHRYSRAH